MLACEAVRAYDSGKPIDTEWYFRVLDGWFWGAILSGQNPRSPNRALWLIRMKREKALADVRAVIDGKEAA